MKKRRLENRRSMVGRIQSFDLLFVTRNIYKRFRKADECIPLCCEICSLL